MKTIIVLISKIDQKGLIYWIESEKEISNEMLTELSSDPDTQLLLNPKSQWSSLEFKTVSIVSFLPGVTDNSANVFTELLNINSKSSEIKNVHSGMLYFDNDSPSYNSLIEKLNVYQKIELIEGKIEFPKNVNVKHYGVEYFKLENLTDRELLKLSQEKKWALSLEEMKAIKEYYSQEKTKKVRLEKGLNPDPTDVEMEIIAQTWSEHCKHKIFNAEIELLETKNNVDSKKTIDSIYKTYVKGATKKINAPWAISVFNDNAGIVDWDENNYLAVKVETHNSPSALDPYGGALTGILGVNRDILGTGLGFKPIANTDVFCVGEWDEQEKLPSRIKHPKTILKGIHRGIEDGGNKSGIPTVNGAICFDENFTGKPLVYCGTIGLAPKKSNNRDNAFKYHEEDQLIIMSGGRVGLDGIHGATMSSIALDENVPNTMVQIGDPFTQKKLADFILHLRDLGLIEGITDNGAGGLSSSIGEMSEKTNGACIDISTIPLKYPGLAPWEIMVSESQERMSFSIKSENLEKVLKISKDFNVESSAIGKFENTGFFEIKNNLSTVGLIELGFLHNGLPRLKLKARKIEDYKKSKWKKNEITKRKITTLADSLNTVIADKNIVSKKYFVENYDHEVMAATVVKGLDGLKQNSVNDSGAIWLQPHGGDKMKAVAVANGIQYMFSDVDCELMAKLSFDEAMRSVVATGANPEKVAMCDNFCWPDPIKSEQNPDGEHKLYQLVKTCQGLFDISTQYKAPLISGKDSMKNDFIEGDLKISIPPTLLMTSIGLIEDVNSIKKSAIKDVGRLLYQLGPKFEPNYFGHFLAKYFQVESNNVFNWDLEATINFYKKYFDNLNLIESAHDVSEGGTIVALSEMTFQNRLGVELNSELSLEFLFSEYPGQIVVSVCAENQSTFEETFKDQFTYLGATNSTFQIKYKQESISLETVESQWSYKWN